MRLFLQPGRRTTHGVGLRVCEPPGRRLGNGAMWHHCPPHPRGGLSVCIPAPLVLAARPRRCRMRRAPHRRVRVAGVIAPYDLQKPSCWSTIRALGGVPCYATASSWLHALRQWPPSAHRRQWTGCRWQTPRKRGVRRRPRRALWHPRFPHQDPAERPLSPSQRQAMISTPQQPLRERSVASQGTVSGWSPLPTALTPQMPHTLLQRLVRQAPTLHWPHARQPVPQKRHSPPNYSGFLTARTSRFPSG